MPVAVVEEGRQTRGADQLLRETPPLGDTAEGLVQEDEGWAGIRSLTTLGAKGAAPQLAPSDLLIKVSRVDPGRGRCGHAGILGRMGNLGKEGRAG